MNNSAPLTTPRSEQVEELGHGESFANEAARIRAFEILQNWEQLAWHASAKNESIPQTRLYFTKILHGMNPDTPDPLFRNAKYGDVRPGHLRPEIAGTGSSTTGVRSAKGSGASTAKTGQASASRNSVAHGKRRSSKEGFDAAGKGKAKDEDVS